MPSSTSPNSSPSGWPGDGLGGLERGAADEDAEAREERLAACRRAGCSSSRSRRGACPAAAAAGEEREPLLLEAREDLLRRQQLDARGRELDRERDALEPAADLRDRLEVLVGELEARLGLLRALDEELHRGRVGGGRARPRARRAAAPRTRARRGREAAPGSWRAPSGPARRRAARRSSAAAGSTCSKLSSTSSVGASPRRSAIASDERPVRRLADAEHVGDRGADELRVLHRREVDEVRLRRTRPAASSRPRARGASCPCRRARSA